MQQQTKNHKTLKKKLKTKKPKKTKTKQKTMMSRSQASLQYIRVYIR